MAASASPDLVVLDLGLPDVPGETVARELRCAAPVPILMLTAKSFQLHSNVVAAVVSLVNEFGMLYQVNYGHVMKNSPHLEPATYLFHGGMTPVHRTDTVDFIDELKFVVFGNTQVTVYFEGTVQVVS